MKEYFTSMEVQPEMKLVKLSRLQLGLFLTSDIARFEFSLMNLSVWSNFEHARTLPYEV